MSTTFFPCEACVSNCGPCPAPLKINGHKYNRMGCSGGIYRIVETLISLDVYLEAGAYPATGITYVQANLAYLGSPTVIATTLGMTIGKKYYRPVSGTGCEFTLGTMYVSYDPSVYIIHSFSVTRTFPATGSTVDELYMSDNPGYGCVPCTNQAGFLVNKIGATEGYNTVNLAPSETGAIGDDCDSSGTSPARVTGVAEWVAGACCPDPVPIYGAGGALQLGGCSPQNRAERIDGYKDGGYCGSVNTNATNTCTTITDLGAPVLGGPNEYSASGTISLSSADGSVSLSLTVAKTACGTVTFSGSASSTASAPTALGEAATTTTETGDFYIDVGNPCYKYKITVTAKGNAYESAPLFGCGFCDGTEIGCNGFAYYISVYREIYIYDITVSIVPL